MLDQTVTGMLFMDTPDSSQQGWHGVVQADVPQPWGGEHLEHSDDTDQLGAWGASMLGGGACGLANEGSAASGLAPRSSHGPIVSPTPNCSDRPSSSPTPSSCHQPSPSPTPSSSHQPVYSPTPNSGPELNNSTTSTSDPSPNSQAPNNNSTLSIRQVLIDSPTLSGILVPFNAPLPPIFSGQEAAYCLMRDDDGVTYAAYPLRGQELLFHSASSHGQAIMAVPSPSDRSLSGLADKRSLKWSLFTDSAVGVEQEMPLPLPLPDLALPLPLPDLALSEVESSSTLSPPLSSSGLLVTSDNQLGTAQPPVSPPSDLRPTLAALCAPAQHSPSHSIPALPAAVVPALSAADTCGETVLMPVRGHAEEGLPAAQVVSALEEEGEEDVVVQLLRQKIHACMSQLR